MEIREAEDLLEQKNQQMGNLKNEISNLQLDHDHYEEMDEEEEKRA